MAPPRIRPTGVERTFGVDELIVSKTDLKGRITYANEVFLRVAQYTEEEIMGQPHNIIRHPAMPRCVFQVLWDTIQAGNEIFAYVVNMARSGDHYWVFAHVTPSYDERGTLIGYHSNRRVPSRNAVGKIKAIYDKSAMPGEASPSSPARSSVSPSKHRKRQSRSRRNWARSRPRPTTRSGRSTMSGRRLPRALRPGDHSLSA